MTEKQRWFKDIFAGLRSLKTEEQLGPHLAAEDRRTEALLADGPLSLDMVRHLYAQSDPLALVLRARLYLEDALDAVVARKFKYSYILLQGRSYSFSVKMDFLRAAGYLDEKLYRDLIHLSRLRNNYAHHLDSDIAGYDLSTFSDCAGLKAVLAKFESADARERIAIFLFRQISLQILLRLVVKHKLVVESPPSPQ